jgi:hypothetical protein
MHIQYRDNSIISYVIAEWRLKWRPQNICQCSRLNTDFFIKLVLIPTTTIHNVCVVVAMLSVFLRIYVISWLWMLVGPCYNLFRVKKQGYIRVCYEGVLGCGSNATIFLNLGTRCRGQVIFTPWLLYPGVHKPWDPLSRRLGGPKNWTGCFGETENFVVRKCHYNKGFWRMFTITVLTNFYFSYVCSVYKVIFRSFTYSIVCSKNSNIFLDIVVLLTDAYTYCPLSVYSIFRLTLFVPVVILSRICLVSCFVSYQPEHIHIAYGGKNNILFSVYGTKTHSWCFGTFFIFPDWWIKGKCY